MPEDFNFDFYRSSYNDISNYDNSQIASHWHNYGKNENRKYKDDKDDIAKYKDDADDIAKYKLPDDFSFNFYRKNNSDLNNFTNSELATHWHNFGKNENRKYKNVKNYKNNKNDSTDYSDDKDDIKRYNMPEDFDFNFYRINYRDLNNFTNSELATHWNKYGNKEKRNYKRNNL